SAARAQVIVTRPTPMGLLIKRLNKSSQNMSADAMNKLCGREWARSQGRGDVAGSWADGERAVKTYLTKNGIDASPLVAVDGTGRGERRGGGGVGGRGGGGRGGGERGRGRGGGAGGGGERGEGLAGAESVALRRV